MRRRFARPRKNSPDTPSLIVKKQMSVVCMGNQSVECGKWEILTFPQNLPRRGSARNPRPDCKPRKGQSVVTCMSKQSWKWAQVMNAPFAGHVWASGNTRPFGKDEYIAMYGQTVRGNPPFAGHVWANSHGVRAGKFRTSSSGGAPNRTRRAGPRRRVRRRPFRH